MWKIREKSELKEKFENWNKLHFQSDRIQMWVNQRSNIIHCCLVGSCQFDGHCHDIHTALTWQHGFTKGGAGPLVDGFSLWRAAGLDLETDHCRDGGAASMAGGGGREGPRVLRHPQLHPAGHPDLHPGHDHWQSNQSTIYPHSVKWFWFLFNFGLIFVTVTQISCQDFTCSEARSNQERQTSAGTTTVVVRFMTGMSRKISF